MEYIRVCSKIESVKDFVGNKFLVRKTHDFIKHGKNVIIFGPTGCGKSTLCRLFKNEFEHHAVYELNKDTFTTTKEVITNLKWFIKNKSILSFFGSSSSQKKQQRAIFIDDYDILINSDKILSGLLITEIVPLLKEYNVQLIITCLTDFHLKKKFQESLKDIEIIKLTYPQPKESYVYLLHILEGMIDGKEEKLLHLINQFKGSIRDTLMHLDTPQTDEELLSSNYRDLSSFEIIKKIFLQHSITPNDISNLMQNDISNISFLLFENIPDELCANRNNKEAIQIYLSILKYLAYSAEIETFAYNNTDWNLFDVSTFMRIDIFRHILNEHPRITHNSHESLRFTQVLSKLSHKNIFAKKINTIRKRSLLSLESVLTLVDVYANENISVKKNTEDSNIITTYKKYFL